MPMIVNAIEIQIRPIADAFDWNQTPIDKNTSIGHMIVMYMLESRTPI